MPRLSLNPRSGVRRLALWAAFGLAMTLSAGTLPPCPASASPPPWAPANGASKDDAPNPDQQPDQPPKQLGTVLTVPVGDVGAILAQNIMGRNQVDLLHVSQVAIGDLHTQVATIAIRHHTKQNWKTLEAATSCWLPAWDLAWIQQANKDSTIVNQSAIGSDNTQVAQVQVQQNSHAPVAPGSRFLMCPASGLNSLLALNPQNLSVVHTSQLSVGDNNSEVALLSVSQQNAPNLQVPGSLAGALVQLNLNLYIINQVAVGNNNTQVVTVNVGQQNLL